MEIRLKHRVLLERISLSIIVNFKKYSAADHVETCC